MPWRWHSSDTPGKIGPQLTLSVRVSLESMRVQCVSISYITEGKFKLNFRQYGQVQQTEVGRVGEERVKRKKVGEEPGRRKKIKVREKVERSGVFFQCFGASDKKSRMHGGHFEDNMWKTDRFWKLRCQESAHRCGTKHISKSKWYAKTPHCRDHFWTFNSHFLWQAQRILHLAKSEQNRKVLWQLLKQWQALDIWKGSGLHCTTLQLQLQLHMQLPLPLPLYTAQHFTALQLQLQLSLPLQLHHNYNFARLHYKYYNYNYNHGYSYKYTTLHYTRARLIDGQIDRQRER